MSVDYVNRRSAPLRTNGYREVVSLLRDMYHLTVLEKADQQKWAKVDGTPEIWRQLTHAQIHHNNQGHIGDIVGVNVFAFVVYDGFPKEALDSIVQGEHLTRELTPPPKNGPIEIDSKFR